MVRACYVSCPERVKSQGGHGELRRLGAQLGPASGDLRKSFRREVNKLPDTQQDGWLPGGSRNVEIVGFLPF